MRKHLKNLIVAVIPTEITENGINQSSNIEEILAIAGLIS